MENGTIAEGALWRSALTAWRSHQMMCDKIFALPAGDQLAEDREREAFIAAWDAGDSVINCPAPDAAGIAVKLEVIVAQERGTSDLMAVIADLNRIT